MKKFVFILAFLMATVMCNAQGGLFQRGDEPKDTRKTEVFNNRGGIPGLPGHGEGGDQPAPLGAGCGLLITFGAAYALYKKKSKSK